jgi:glycosyltransferase involved in cell wall biosynthesis
MTLSVIVPAYNEERTIGEMLPTLVKAIPAIHEIIVVDDGSTDHTADKVKQFQTTVPSVKLICLERNQGKTAALKAGFAASTGEIVIVQDADLEYDPQDIPSVIEPILSGRADVVYGSRFLVRRAARVLFYRHFLGNSLITFFSNVLTDLNFSDVETGYKAFRGEIIRNMIIMSSGFGFEIEVTAKAAKLKCRIYEVPISYYGRTYEEGKKIGFWDGVSAIFYILRFTLFWTKSRSFTKIPL